MPKDKTLKREFFVMKYLDIHQPNALANGLGKGEYDVHCRCDPFCETVVAVFGFTECRDLVSKDIEDSLRGVAGLEAGKERMRG
jgi:hypothetical protein